MERFIDFQPSVEADSPTGELSAGKRHQARVQQINEAQAKAFGLPPVPAEGVDPFGALRNWLKRETGQFQWRSPSWSARRPRLRSTKGCVLIHF